MGQGQNVTKRILIILLFLVMTTSLGWSKQLLDTRLNGDFVWISPDYQTKTILQFDGTSRVLAQFVTNEGYDLFVLDLTIEFIDYNSVNFFKYSMFDLYGNFIKETGWQEYKFSPDGKVLAIEFPTKGTKLVMKKME